MLDLDRRIGDRSAGSGYASTIAAPTMGVVFVWMISACGVLVDEGEDNKDADKGEESDGDEDPLAIRGRIRRGGVCLEGDGGRPYL